MLAGLVDPQPMRLEIGGHGDLRHRHFVLLAQGRDDLGRQEMRVDDQVPLLALEEANQLAEVELFQGEAEAVAAVLAGPAGLIEQVVEIAEDVRRVVDQVKVSPAIDPAKQGVGQLEDVLIAHGGRGQHLAQGQLDRLGGPEMAGTDGRGQDKDAGRSAHGSCA